MLTDVCMRVTNRQPQGHVQVLLNILRGFGVQAALDAPRFCISAGSPDTESTQSGQSGDINSEVYFEEASRTRSSRSCAVRPLCS